MNVGPARQIHHFPRVVEISNMLYPPEVVLSLDDDESIQTVSDFHDL